MNNFKTIFYLAIAIFFFSLSFNLFQEPSGLVTGGVTGIVLVLHQLFDVKISLTTLLINSIFLVLGFIFIGKEFFFKTVLGSILFYPLFLEILPNVKLSDDLLVNAVLGGILMGVGIAFLYVSGGSSGGTSLLARILIKYVKIPFAIAIFIFDGSIILSGFIVFGIDKGVYALIFIFTSTFISNFFESKLSSKNQVLVHSDDSKIRDYLFTQDCCTIIEFGADENIFIFSIPDRLTKKIEKDILNIDKDSKILISQIKEKSNSS